MMERWRRGCGRGGHDEARSADQNHVQECAKVHAAEPAAEGLGSAGRGRRRGEDPLNRGAHRFDDLATVLTRCGAGTYTLELYDEDGGLLREMRV
ncbi:hypothetical protein ACFQV4_33020 [Streptomyces thermocarboxydus]